MRSVLAGAVLIALAVSTNSAAAQDDAERTALARSLFQQGVELSDQGQWAQAADHFRRSLSLRYSPVAAFNFGTALTHVGRLVEAREHFRRASRDSDAPERLRDAARREVEAIEPRLGSLTVEVEGPLDTVVLELDGDAVPREMVGVAAPADPGHRVIRALRAQVEVARAEVDVPEGGQARVRLEVPPLVASAIEAAEALVPPDGSDPRGRPPIIVEAGDDTLVWVGAVTAALVAVAAAILTTVLVLDGQGSVPPVEGNLGPPVIVFE